MAIPCSPATVTFVLLACVLTFILTLSFKIPSNRISVLQQSPSISSYPINQRKFQCPTALYSSKIMERLYSRGGGYSKDNQDDLVLDDFDHILDAVYVYKKTFDDLNIPIKFEVPNTHPWPLHLHGLRLGKRLEKLLGTPEFFSSYPDKVEELEKLGFKANLSSLVDDWNLIFDALKIYKDLHGDLRIQSKFVVPDEEPWPRMLRKLKLGVRIAAVRSAGRYVKDHPDRKLMLDNLGFEWRIRDNTYRQQVVEEQFDQMLEALTLYKQIFSSVEVPAKFVVPEEKPWPEALWGIPLGTLAANLRKKNSMAFGREDRETKLKACRPTSHKLIAVVNIVTVSALTITGARIRHGTTGGSCDLCQEAI